MMKKLSNIYLIVISRHCVYVKNQQEVEEMALDIFTYVWENRAGGVLKLKCSLRKVVDCNYDIKKGSYQALY